MKAAGMEFFRGFLNTPAENIYFSVVLCSTESLHNISSVLILSHVYDLLQISQVCTGFPVLQTKVQTIAFSNMQNVWC